MYEKLQALLDKTNKTAYRVAKDIGVTPASIAMVKKRGGEFSWQTIVKLSEYFGVPLEYWSDGESEEKKFSLFSKLKRNS